MEGRSRNDKMPAAKYSIKAYFTPISMRENVTSSAAMAASVRSMTSTTAPMYRKTTVSAARMAERVSRRRRIADVFISATADDVAAA